MKAPTMCRIVTAEPIGIIRDQVNYAVSNTPAELVGFIATPHGAPEGSWEFFHEGDVDEANYPDSRPVYAPIGSNNNTNKETP